MNILIGIIFFVIGFILGVFTRNILIKFIKINNKIKEAERIIAEEKKIYKGVSANVDFYSGFMYNMLGLPQELYTPLFAIARIAGWSAHRMEELINLSKIIRPAYMSVAKEREYTPLSER